MYFFHPKLIVACLSGLLYVFCTLWTIKEICQSHLKYLSNWKGEHFLTKRHWILNLFNKNWVLLYSSTNPKWSLLRLVFLKKTSIHLNTIIYNLLKKKPVEKCMVVGIFFKVRILWAVQVTWADYPMRINLNFIL